MAKARVLQTLCALAVVAVFACSDSGQGTSSQIEEQTPNDTGVNILTSVFPSPKEKNPFSVENMNKAFKNFVLENNPNAKDIPELEANFLYVRFLPYGKQGEYELKTYDSSLALFRRPMDYNKIREPAVYIDETLPDSIIPYFASVPVGYEFGSTPYEILQELFLTQPLEEDVEADGQEGSRFVKAKKSNKANKEIAAYLKSQGLAPSQFEAAVLFSSGNSEIVEAADGQNKILAKSALADDMVAWSWPWEKWTRWTPGGKLTFIDTLEGKELELPLVGARVTAGYLFYWRSSRTNNEGKFKSPEKWTFSVRYEVIFDSDDFLLKDGHSWGGWYAVDLSYKKEGTSYQQWEENFTGNKAKWCVVWTAAWNYWKGNDIGGLQRPRYRNGWLDRMDIKVYYKKNNFGDYGMYRNPAIFEDIQIQAYDRKHVEIYGSTIHEIAHSVHYANMDIPVASLGNMGIYVQIGAVKSLQYDNLPDRLKESYARGVQRYLVIKRYGAEDWDGSYDNQFYNDEYTGIFEDLEDTVSTFAQKNKYCDRVSGITVPMAEEVLFYSESWNGFKNNLMKKYPDGTINNEGKRVTYTKEDMDALFKYWETLDGSTSCSEPVTSNAKPSNPNAIAGSLTDIRDKKVYKTAAIGTQVWMAENLNYNASGSACYSNYAANCATYGRLYNWATAMALPYSCNSTSCSVKATHQGVCPSGWHIPSMEDWNKLMRYVDNVNNTRSPYDSPTAGIHLKAASGWSNGGNPGGSGKDTYGFSALPGGIGNPSGSGFSYLGYNGDWWSTAEYDGSSAYRFDLYYGDKAGWSDVGGTNRRFDKTSLYSIRCLKD